MEGFGNDRGVIRRIFTLLLLGLAMPACGYSSFDVRPESVKSEAHGTSVEAHLLGDSEWDSGGRDDLLAVQVTVRNSGELPLDVEPWDFVLSSTRVETRPLSPLKAAVASSWHHPQRSTDGYGLLRFTFNLLYLPVEKFVLCMEKGPNTERLDDFAGKALRPATLAPGGAATGILFYEETLSSRVELGWTVWAADGTPLRGPELLLQEKKP